MRKLIASALLLLLAAAVPLPAGVVVSTDGAQSLMQLGQSARPTYIAAVSAQATTAASLLSIESSSSTGFKLIRLCVSSSAA